MIFANFAKRLAACVGGLILAVVGAVVGIVSGLASLSVVFGFAVEPLVHLSDNSFIKAGKYFKFAFGNQDGPNLEETPLNVVMRPRRSF